MRAPSLFVPAFQAAHFGRVYAAYGRRIRHPFALVGRWFDGRRPDAAHTAGALRWLMGVAVIMY